MKDQFTVRRLERHIIKSTKQELVQYSDINHKQKICPTLLTDSREPLHKYPKSWDEIKNKKFMIAIRQHSVTASKELQEDSCGQIRQREVRKWEAYIISLGIKLHQAN